MHLFKVLLALPADSSHHGGRLSGTGSGYLAALLFAEQGMACAHAELSDEMIRFSSPDGEVYLS